MAMLACQRVFCLRVLDAAFADVLQVQQSQYRGNFPPHKFVLATIDLSRIFHRAEETYQKYLVLCSLAPLSPHLS